MRHEATVRVLGRALVMRFLVREALCADTRVCVVQVQTKAEAEGLKTEAAEEAEALQEVYEAYMKQFYMEAALREAEMTGVSIKQLADVQSEGGEGGDVKPDVLAADALAAASNREREASDDAAAQASKRPRHAASALPPRPPGPAFILVASHVAVQAWMGPAPLLVCGRGWHNLLAWRADAVHAVLQVARRLLHPLRRRKLASP